MWYQNLDQSYRVVNFIEDVKEWEQEGFLDERIWTQLANKIEQGVLPISPELIKPKEPSPGIPSEEGNLAPKLDILKINLIVV